MTAEKFYEKAGKLLDENYDNVYYENTNDGAYFTLDGIVAFYLPGQQICTVRGTKKDVTISKLFRYDSKLADVIIHGKTPRVHSRLKAVTYLKNKENDIRAYVKTRYFKLFPSNALFYVSGRNKPVTVGVYDNRNGLKILGLIMPVNIDDDAFVSKES